jgi:cytochrome c553
MRTLIRVVGWIFATLMLLVGTAVASVYIISNHKLHRTFEVSVQAPVVPSGPEAIARGQHLAKTRGCAECHGADLAGAKVIDNPAMGKLHGPNLTRGRGGLPEDFSDMDFERAIRHGVAKDGHGLFLMPSIDFAHFTTEDMGCLIAYVRSVPPVDRDRVPLSIGPVARTLMLAGKIKLSADVIDHTSVRADEVTPEPTVTYGRYVAASCIGCHGPNFSGGKIDIGPPDWPPARNLTPAGELAKWTEADFFRALREHTRPDGTKLNVVMPAAFGGFNDTEIKALWAYLQTVPAAATGSR